LPDSLREMDKKKMDNEKWAEILPVYYIININTYIGID
jgi:hypothetical protein